MFEKVQHSEEEIENLETALFIADSIRETLIAVAEYRPLVYVDEFGEPRTFIGIIEENFTQQLLDEYCSEGFFTKSF